MSVLQLISNLYHCVLKAKKKNNFCYTTRVTVVNITRMLGNVGELRPLTHSETHDTVQYSTETVLVKVVNDVLPPSEQGCVSISGPIFI